MQRRLTARGTDSAWKQTPLYFLVPDCWCTQRVARVPPDKQARRPPRAGGKPLQSWWAYIRHAPSSGLGPGKSISALNLEGLPNSRRMPLEGARRLAGGDAMCLLDNQVCSAHSLFTLQISAPRSDHSVLTQATSGHWLSFCRVREEQFNKAEVRVVMGFPFENRQRPCRCTIRIFHHRLQFEAPPPPSRFPQPCTLSHCLLYLLKYRIKSPKQPAYFLFDPYLESFFQTFLISIIILLEHFLDGSFHCPGQTSTPKNTVDWELRVRVAQGHQTSLQVWI